MGLSAAEFFRIGGESWLLVIWVTVDLLLMLHSSWVVIPLYAVVSR